MESPLAWAAAIAVAILPVLYPILGLKAIMRGLNPPTPYWRRRLLLNLMETNLGMYLNLGLALAAAVLMSRGDPLAWPLVAAAAGVDLVYTVWIVVLTPRDWWHALPTGMAAVEYGAAWLLRSGGA